MSCDSPCGRDIAIPAVGLGDFVDHTPHPVSGGYVAGFAGPRTLTWTIPADLDVASVDFRMECTVVQGCPRLDIGGSLFFVAPPGTYVIEENALPGATYDAATRTYTATVSARPSDNSFPSIQGEYNHPDYVLPGHPELGVNYPSRFSDSFFFELDIACFNLIVRLKCPTSTTEIPSGSTETICADLSRTTGVSEAFLPDWIRRGYGWVIFKVGRPDYWAHGPQISAAPAVKGADVCGDLTISMPCSTLPLETLPLGGVIDGPLYALRLMQIFQDGSGYTYDVARSRPFNWTQAEICDGVETPPIIPVDPIPGGTKGIDVLYWKEGYHVVQVEDKEDHQELRGYRRWHSDMEFEDGSVLIDRTDPGGRITNPRLSHPADVPPLSVVYRKDAGGDSDLYRKESYDYGETWMADPEEGKPYRKGVALAHVEEVWNDRTAEKVLLHGGSGGISATIYGPDKDPDTGMLVEHETYKVVDAADNASFGGLFDPPSGGLDIAFQVDGKRKIYRSQDDGRSWQDVTEA